MKKIFFIIFILTFLGVTEAYSNILHVPGSYATIQSAINSSSNGDTVLVEPGTYLENINFRGKRIVVTSRYYLNNDPTFINSTIINGSSPSQPDSASCVRITSGEDSTTVLQGFTITGGTGTKWEDIHNAGRYREGGGILIELSSPVIQNNIIINNQATNTQGVTSAGGGGMRIGDSYPMILNNAILFNSGRYGPGIVLNYTGCIIKNNVICSNSGGQDYNGGSGIWAWQNISTGLPKIFENNSIVNNSATVGTAGILVWSTTVTIRNNIVWGNSSPSGVQILLLSGIANVTYCDVQGGYTGAGNINLDPVFADTNYILNNNSTCVDKGDSSTIYNDPEDPQHLGFAKYPSRGTIRNDMGAYGGKGTDLISGMLIGIIRQNSQVPGNFKLSQNYPNPFNPATKISFYIPYYVSRETSNVKIIVYDIAGRIISVLLDDNLMPGKYEVKWDGTNYASGIYFYKLLTDGFSETNKMILIK
jgi:hypothetical protein